MRGFRKAFMAVFLQLFLTSCLAEQATIKSLAYTTTDNMLSLSFDVSHSPKHHVFTLDHPARLVVDISNVRLEKAIDQPPKSHPLFLKVRWAQKNTSDLRVVVDLKKPISAKEFSIESKNTRKHGMTVDLVSKNAINPIITKNSTHKKSVTKAAKARTVTKTPNHFVIAIDAGHGGDDPGAIGPKGTKEKQVTFAIAKKLAKLIDADKGMKAVLIRDGDYFVSLRQRIDLARAAEANLFISIHADAVKNVDARGASVYTLSKNGASSEAARWLADNENAADLIGGVSLDDKEDVLKSVLFDLYQGATQEASANLARHVLKHFQNVCDLHKGSVQKAGFLVLKSPDIPSILVETAFISNPQEEQNLQSPSYQSKIAKAIFRGVSNYFKQANVIIHTAENS